MGESAPRKVVTADTVRVAVVRARFNDHVTSGLLAGAEHYLDGVGASYDIYEVPGAFELPLACAVAADSGYDAVVALGAVINGETDHYQFVAGRASEGLMQVALEARIPVAFGVLTVQEEGQALARSRPGPDNKGAEAAAAAVETAIMLRSFGTRG